MTKNENTLLTTCRLIEFTDARIDEVSVDFHPYLVVSGLKAYANMRVELNPHVYVEGPEYWAIEVVGCITKYALPAVTPFEVMLPLDWPAGTKGIRIVGANGQVQFIDWKYSPASNPDDGGKQIIIAVQRHNPG